MAVSPHGPVKVTASLGFYEDFTDNFSPSTLPDVDRDYLMLADVSLDFAGIDASSKIKSLSYSMTPELEEGYEHGSLTPTSIRGGRKTTALSLETYSFREALMYNGKNVSISFVIGPETYEIAGVLHAKNVSFAVGEKLTSSLSVRSNSYGGAPVLRESNTGAQKSAGDYWHIYGYNLLDTTAVYFNNNIRANEFTTHARSPAAPYDYNSEIKVKIPRFAKSGPIKVFTPYGEAAHEQRTEPAPGGAPIIANIDPTFIP